MCTVFEMSAFKKYHDLGTQVRGRLIASFDRSHMPSYLHSILSLVLACTISDIQHNAGANSPFSTILPFFHTHCEELLPNFLTTFGVLKLQSLYYCAVKTT